MANTTATRSRIRAPIAETPTTQRAWLVPLLIFLAAFTVRFIHLYAIQGMPTFDDPTMDEGYHMELVRQINSPEGYPDEPYFRAPLYPYFLALTFKLTGQSFFGVRLIQILLGSLVPVLIYLLGLRLFNRTVALWSAAVAVLYPTLIYYDSSLLISLLEVLLSTLAVLLLYRCDGKSTWPWIAAGAVIGLAGIARPTLLLFGPALLVWAWFVLKPQLGLKQAATKFALIGICAVVVVAPVTIRNYLVSGEFVTVSWQGGYNFFVGNNAKASGWSARVEGIDASWRGGYVQSIAIAEKAEGRDLSFTEVSDYWSDSTWTEIGKNSGQWLGLLVKKARLLVNGYEIPNNQDEYLTNEFSSLMDLLLHRGALYFPYGLLAPLGIVGLLISLREWRKHLIVYLFMGAFSASLILFFVCARFRQPLIPFMILFAVFGVWTLIQYVQWKRYRQVAIYGALALLLMIESNHDMLGLKAETIEAENRDLLGNAYLRKGKFDLALVEYQKAVAADPTYGRGFNNIGTVLTRQRRYAEAAPYLEKAMQFDGRLPEPYVNLSICYSETGDTSNAVRILEQARRKFPNNAHVFYFLSMAYLDVGRFDDAVAASKESVRLDPANSQFRQLLRELEGARPAPAKYPQN